MCLFQLRKAWLCQIMSCGSAQARFASLLMLTFALCACGCSDCSQACKPSEGH